MNPTDLVRCRRCGRPLYDPLAVAVELGARCALLAAVDAADGPQTPAPVPDATEPANARLKATVRPHDDGGR